MKCSSADSSRDTRFVSMEGGDANKKKERRRHQPLRLQPFAPSEVYVRGLADPTRHRIESQLSRGCLSLSVLYPPTVASSLLEAPSSSLPWPKPRLNPEVFRSAGPPPIKIGEFIRSQTSLLFRACQARRSPLRHNGLRIPRSASDRTEMRSQPPSAARSPSDSSPGVPSPLAPSTTRVLLATSRALTRTAGPEFAHSRPFRLQGSSPS